MNAEQTAKIKNAVKAKLVEIGAYVDDQLSDYVMIMITNKKSEKQMTEDLELFLGGLQQSSNFSSWLHSLIKKIMSNESEHSSSKSKTSSKMSKSSSSAATLNVSAQEPADELAIQIDTNEFNEDFGDDQEKNKKEKINSSDTSKKSKKQSISSSKSSEHQKQQSVSTRKKSTSTNDSNSKSSKEKQNKQTDQKQQVDQQKALSSNITKEKTTSMPTIAPNQVDKSNEAIASKPINATESLEHVKSLTKPSISSQIGAVINKIPSPTHHERKSDNDDDDDEDFKSSKMKKRTGIASVIRVSDRKFTVPKSMQPNKSILLKAVSAANTSVAASVITTNTTSSTKTESTLKSKSIADEKLQEIRSKRFGLESAVEKRDLKRSLSPSPPSHTKSSSKVIRLNRRSANEIISDKRRAVITEDEVVLKSHTTEDLKSIFLTTSGDRRQVQIGIDPSKQSHQSIIFKRKEEDEEEEVEMNDDNLSTCSTSSSISNSNVNININSNPKEPTFIVTLNGLNDETLLKKYDNNSSKNDDNDAMINNDEDDMMMMMHDEQSVNDSENMEFDTKQEQQQTKKKITRCTFWPMCDKGDSCAYLHPNKPCTMFPACSFGQQCHYLHPSCRFDGFCTRLDCPFTHVIKKPSLNATNPNAVTSNEQTSVVASTIPTIEQNAEQTTASLSTQPAPSPSKPNGNTTKQLAASVYNVINKPSASATLETKPQAAPEAASSVGTKSLVNYPTMLGQVRMPRMPSPFASTFSNYSLFKPNQYALVNKATANTSLPAVTINCKYGAMCLNQKCIYSHPNFPQKSQLKWNAALANSTNQLAANAKTVSTNQEAQ